MFELAAAFQDQYDIVFAATEYCSQSRLRWLCRHFGVTLKRASARRFSEAILSEVGQAVLFGELTVDAPFARTAWRATATDLVERLRARANVV